MFALAGPSQGRISLSESRNPSHSAFKIKTDMVCFLDQSFSSLASSKQSALLPERGMGGSDSGNQQELSDGFLMSSLCYLLCSNGHRVHQALGRRVAWLVLGGHTGDGNISSLTGSLMRASLEPFLSKDKMMLPVGR